MDAILKINNDFSYLITQDSQTLNTLWEKLRFRQKGYYHTRAYKQGVWDGFVDFFNKKNGKFLTGLLPEMRIALNYFGINYTVVDERTNLDFTCSSIDEYFMREIAPPGEPDVMYNYQVDLVNQTIKHKRGIISAPPGAGKTLIMLAIMKALPKGTPILFLANRTDLINQNYKEMKKWGFPNVGRFYSKYHEPNIITCSTVQSAHLLNKLLPKFKAVVADEIHLLSNPTSIRAFKKLTGAYIRVAVSATPFKHGGTDDVQKYTIKGFFGPIFRTNAVEGGILKISDLQKEGNLSGANCTFYYIDDPKDIEYDIFIDAVTNGVANNWYFHQLVSKLAIAQKGRTLILVERTIHGDHLNGLIPNSLWVYGKDDEQTRNYVIEQMQTSKDNVVAIGTRQIFDTGINFKVHNIIDCCINAPEHGIIQLTGRGLRLADDKTCLNYYSFIHRTNKYLEKHSRAKVRTLKKEKQNVIIKDEIDF